MMKYNATNASRTTVKTAMTTPALAPGARPVGGESGAEGKGSEVEEFPELGGYIGIIDGWAFLSHLHWETEKLRRS